MVVELLKRFFRGRRPVVALLVLLLASLLLMSYATRNSDRFSEL